MLHKNLKHKNGMTYVKKLQHNRAKKLCFMVSKWLADWHYANSVVDTVWFLFCHTLYIMLMADTKNVSELYYLFIKPNVNFQCLSIQHYN